MSGDSKGKAAAAIKIKAEQEMKMRLDKKRNKNKFSKHKKYVAPTISSIYFYLPKETLTKACESTQFRWDVSIKRFVSKFQIICETFGKL